MISAQHASLSQIYTPTQREDAACAADEPQNEVHQQLRDERRLSCVRRVFGKKSHMSVRGTTTINFTRKIERNSTHKSQILPITNFGSSKTDVFWWRYAQ